MIIRAYKVSIVFIVFGLCYFAYSAFASPEQGKVSFEITSIGLRHGTPSDVHLWTLSTTAYDQELSGHLNEYFWIEDMQWYITGHYTTIQCDGIYWPQWYVITWVYFKAGNTYPTLLQWNTGNVYIYPSLYTYTSILSPMTYLYKTTSLSHAGITNIYGDMPWFKILIPANAPAGSYSGTITFSFYMD